MLHLRTDEGDEIRHPLLLQRVDLVFHEDVPEFRVVDGSDPPELNTTLLKTIAGVDGLALSRYREELERAALHPLDGLLVLMRPDNPYAAVRMVVYNRDGGRAEACGNGSAIS